jgi:zinc D-Ala-D-Ala carboxypeptidase
MIQLTPHFTAKEVACPCCGDDKVKTSSINRLERARMYAGIPFHVNSGKRCPAHNLAEGGKKKSAHLYGYAFDIAVSNSHERFIILSALIRAGFTRIGIGKNFIHGDDSPDLPPEVSWLY